MASSACRRTKAGSGELRRASIGGAWIGRGLEIEIDLTTIDREPPVVGVDPAPRFAILPGQRLACESSGPVESEVEAGDHPLPNDVLGHPTPNAKPRRAPGRAPRIANF